MMDDSWLTVALIVFGIIALTAVLLDIRRELRKILAALERRL